VNPVWPHGDPRAVAQAILADSRYRSAPQRAAPKSFWDVAWEALRHWLSTFFKPLGHVLGDDRVTTTVGILILVVAVMFLIVVTVRFVRPYLRTRKARAAPGAGALAGAGSSAARLRARAMAAAAAGRYREAAALLWASALHALDEAGRVRFDPARTPGEWRRAVRDPAFDALERDAVVALFGGSPVDAALVARMRDAYDAVLASA